jgi:hypothetical protein
LEKQLSVRYGRNYLVVLAIVCPSLLIIPFIFILTLFPHLAEWQIWVTIFTFIASIIALSFWLIFNIYPIAVLNIRNAEISLTFKRSRLFGPASFSFYSSDIKQIKEYTMGSANYIIVETANPSRKFQISASSYKPEDILEFESALSALQELAKTNSVAF